ncbi:MAG TPA: right-handed parallel beta-helix repeat-containing protein [Rhizomicrobium sp.]
MSNITFTGSDVVIADNIVQQARGWAIAAQGARQMRILGNYFDNNGKGDLGTGAIDIENSGLVTITGNTFHRTGGASEGVATTSHVFFEGADDSSAQ